ncbi:ABC transporter ATP-binding protein [Streptomyces europaeiscabiei]|uniref:ABC transporter ATP-binding protein n=1 Tax=Streptomyces europaeiscabiei TaxID=146819 RepID=A0AAJ2PSX5_9ACTN|nr:ABC transporter ATP-binding protein [Streptomyces europaeiscabiei]MDX3132617.1 ABC transporter ATP-binding protein [Streptomyces europaeiscabiei]
MAGTGGSADSGPVPHAEGRPRATGRSQGAEGRHGPGTWRRIAETAAPFRRHLAALLILVVLESALIVFPALLTQRIVDEGVLHGDRGRIVVLVLEIVLLATVAVGVTLAQRRLAAGIGEGITLGLRRSAFSHVQRMPLSFFTRMRTGALVTRLDNDVQGAQHALTGTAAGLLSNLVAVVTVGITMILLSWQITLLAAVLVPACLLPARFLDRRLRELNRRRLDDNAELSTFMTERFNVRGAMLAKLYGRAEEEDRSFGRRGSRLRDTGIRLVVANSLLGLAVSWLATMATAAVYLAGGFLAVDGRISVGTMIALVTLLARLYGPITSLSQAKAEVTAAVVSFERIFEVLDLVPAVADTPGAGELPADAASIQFDRVSLRHRAASADLTSWEAAASGPAECGTDPGAGERDVLRDVSLCIEAGRTVAVVGPSGAGKSTLVNLVCRLHDPTAGVVRIGGHDIRRVTQESLRSAIGVVAQEGHFFHDTLRANLTYARADATDEECEAACREAMVWDTVRRLPGGLDTLVGDGGHHLSGGERQRFAIARLLLKNPRIVVLDEATAHLDSESEAQVQQALVRAMAGRTAMVVAHRLSTVRGADLIVVLRDGAVVETGNHEELLAAGGAYTSLYRAQFDEPRPPVPAGPVPAGPVPAGPS